MKKENRYYVIKCADLDIALDKGLINSNDVDTLRRIHKSCATARDQVGKKRQDYCVVESDWPMYELVWEYISCWAEGTVNPAERQSIFTRILANLCQRRHEDLPITEPEIYKLLQERGAIRNRETCSAKKSLRVQRHALIGHKLCRAIRTPGKELYQVPEDQFLSKIKRIIERLYPVPRTPLTEEERRQASTQYMLDARSRELRAQEEALLKKLRDFEHDKAIVEVAYERSRSPKGYDSLGRVLREVMHQCAIGKGNKRHANGKAFIDQPILAYSREYKSPVGLLFQIRKKLDEFDRLDGIARRRELLGAIVYLAALVIFDQEQRGYELMPEANLNGVGYLA